MTPVFAFGLPEVAAVALLVALNAYVLMGGADFGGGTWDLLASGPRREAQRELVASAIGPIWEANHVWLIVAVVIAFTVFPAAFAAIVTVLHIPLLLMLFGIVLRGSAFVFRAYGSRSGSARMAWGRIFAISSAATPVLLGVIIGADSTNAVGAAYQQAGRAPFAAVFVAPWLAPFPITVGVMALALFAMLAATYLTVAARDQALREDFRLRALWSAGAAAVAAGATLAIARSEAPFMHEGLTQSRWSAALLGATGLAAVAAVWALWRRRFGFARVAAGAEVSLILWGWAAAQFPFLVPGALTMRAAAAPAATIQAVLWILAGGAMLLVPSLVFLLRTFAPTRPRAGER